MGWGYGRNPDGREVGYTVVAICDLEGCEEKIDRGLAYVCGSMHGGDEYCCGGYFCPRHLVMGIGLPNQMCINCADEYDKDKCIYCDESDVEFVDGLVCEKCADERDGNG